MNRTSSITLALAAVLVGGSLLLASRNGDKPSCGEGEPCSAKETPVPRASPPMASPSSAASAPAPQAEEADGDDGVALRDQADRLIGAGKIQEGLEVFRRAVAADPSAKNHGDLGGLLYGLTAYDEAAIHLRAAAELDPMNADRWIALANVYYRKVDLGEAWKAEKRAREAEPGLELARDGSGMRIRKGDKAPREP
jgi:tetratricopeptide (TPR) repeat protein